MKAMSFKTSLDYKFKGIPFVTYSSYFVGQIDDMGTCTSLINDDSFFSCKPRIASKNIWFTCPSC